MPTSRIVRFEKNCVVKIDNPARMRVEVEKAYRAHLLGQECGLFYSPEVLDYNDAKGRAEFELVKSLEPFNHCSRWGKKYDILVSNVARALAAIHRELQLPAEINTPVDSEFELAGKKSFLHGDFNGHNVCVAKGSSIVILDWSLSDLVGGYGTYGSRYLDVMWFAWHMLWHFDHRFIGLDKTLPASKLFTRVYVDEAGLTDEPVALSQSAYKFFSLMSRFTRTSASRRIRCMFVISRLLTRNFLKSIQP